MHLTPDHWAYLVFGIALTIALALDLGLLSKTVTSMSLRKALWLTLGWVALALAFFGFLWKEEGGKTAAEYLSAYLMEWSLSLDNIFAFILLFRFFRIGEAYYARVLIIGILIAIVLRILFISGGLLIILVAHWILYVFGALLIYMGIRMFRSKSDGSFDPGSSKVYQFLHQFLRLTDESPKGKYVIIRGGKRYLTPLMVVIILLATTDVLFALDSIPAVFAISHHAVVVYTSNIFAVLGLRSLFFLLTGAVRRFRYLPQGISVILILIGLKMLAEIGHVYLPVYWSLCAIVICLGASIVYSLYHRPNP